MSDSNYEREEVFSKRVRADKDQEPSSAGRSMNGHFSTRMLDDNGNWLKQTDRINISSDISPTASQMPRVLGLAFASKIYKSNKDLHTYSRKRNLTQFL